MEWFIGLLCLVALISWLFFPAMVKREFRQTQLNQYAMLEELKRIERWLAGKALKEHPESVVQVDPSTGLAVQSKIPPPP